MYFRSSAEIAIASELDKRNVLFFGNVRGRLQIQDLPAAKASQSLSGRVELDFLVFKNGKCLILEVKVCSAFWYDTPSDRTGRLKLERELILRWQSPFNKENWNKYGKPFGKIYD